MVERVAVPFIVGITGKRDLLGKDQSVRGALGACFALLDDALPATRKILMTGLAAGTDTLAAEIALARGWKVIAVLPFALDEFARDFDADGARRLRALADPGHGLLQDPAKGRVIVLPPLLDPSTGGAAEAAALVQADGQSNPIRNDHSEQIGHFIAERCALLIAVMSAGETPDRVGGTARVVQYRLRGPFDPIAERIAAQSQVLRQPMDLDTPQGGPVWLVDLATVESATVDRSPDLGSVELWEPRAEDPAATISVEQLADPGETGLRRSLRFGRQINAFNILATGITERQWRREVTFPASGSADASGTLKDVQHALSIIQGSKKRAFTRTVKAMATLFVLAVIAIESHLHLETLPPLIVYVVLLLMVLLVFGFARLRALQQFVEDYRAIAEALRVQAAWWDGGLVGRAHRVAYGYLRGTTGSLAAVRSAARYLVETALVEQPAPQAAPARVRDWIDGQIAFFESRARERRRALARFEDVIWFLFMVSIGMAVSLIPLTLALHHHNALLGWMDGLLTASPAVSRITPWATLAGVVTLFGLTTLLSRRAERLRFGARRWLLEGANVLLGFSAGLMLATAMYSLVFGPSDLAGALTRLGLNHGQECLPGHLECIHAVAHKVIAGLMVVVAAVAGAIRFYAERLALDAELHSYREALVTFRRARQDLAAADATQELTGRRQQVLLELGRVALNENESWIRAHRVRPLEPHL
ncbi:MAG: hypothetical protein IT537_02340 [Hyphomicrobiales bacterium]|nr:hypothetical protein [Hyphomicrobiales bacterium]